MIERRISWIATNLFFLTLLVALSFALAACAPSGDGASPADNSATSGGPVEPVGAPKFWIEPSSKNVVGVGQTMSLFSAYKANGGDAFPIYLDPSQVRFSVSDSKVLSVDSKGLIVGLTEGNATITATYSTYKSQLAVQVSGAMVKRTIPVTSQGVRTYLLYVPSLKGLAGPFPLMVSLHGGGGTAMNQAATSLLNTLANDQKFYVAYPEGSGAIQTFNAGACCGYAQTHTIDDTAMVRAVLSDIQRNYAVAADKIYASGFSNGSIMSHRLACELADKISGIAAFSGGSGEFDSNMARYFFCVPSRPIRILHFHATNDRNYPILGGAGDGSSATPFYPIASTISDWLQRNNFSSQGTTESPSGRVTCTRYETPLRAGVASAPVVACTSDPADVYDSAHDIVFGGGHSWPGGVRGNSPSADVPSSFNANAYMWNVLTK